MYWRRLLIGLSLVALTWAVFGQTRHFKFVAFDDSVYIYENVAVLNGLTAESVRWAFSREAIPVTGNWHPLTWLSLMLDTELFGTDAGGFHLTNVVLHTVNVLLLFWLLTMTTGAPWKSGFAAALFAVHPLHVESVAWVSERKDVLSTFFGLIALLGYVQYSRHSSVAGYVASLIAFVLSLLSKQMLVTLPFLLLLLDYWPLCRTRWGAWASVSEESAAAEASHGDPEAARPSWGRLWAEKLPFFAITIIFCAVAFLSQDHSKTVVSVEMFSIGSRLRNSTEVYVLYLVQTVWPSGLACFYPHPGSIPAARAIGAGALLLLMSVVALVQRQRRPYLPVGWFWYLGTLVPVIGLVQIGSQRMADRYTYIPLIGVFVAVSWAVPSLMPAGRARRVVLPVLSLSCLLALSIVGWRQTRFWRDNEALFQRAAAVTEQNDLAHYNLAEMRYKDGRYEESIAHSRAVLQIHPRDAAARNTLGLALAQLGRHDEAIEQYLASLAIYDDDAEVHNNLGLALHSSGRLDQASECFMRALEIDPDSAIAHYNLGNLWGDLNRFDQAIVEFEQAVRIDPDNGKFHNNLGLALLIDERSEDAVDHFVRSLEIDPHDALAHFNLARALLQTGDHEQAAERLQESLRLDPSLKGAAEDLQRRLETTP